MRTQQQDLLDEEDESAGGGLDAELVKSYAAFVSRALRKRALLAFGIFCGVVVLVSMVLAVWPRTYYCEARLTAQSAGALGNDEGREEPSRKFDGAVASVMRYDNLAAIVDETDLVRHWSESRAPVHRLKDAIVHRLFGEPSEKDKKEALVATLQNNLTVDTTGGILTLAATWPEPQMATRLVEAAMQNFLESRHVSEISMLAENISILEGHVGRVRNEIYEIADNVKKLREEKRLKAEQGIANAAAALKADAGAPAPAPKVARVPALTPPVVDEELAGTKTLLDAKELALKEIEAERARNLRDLQAKLRELKLTYTDVHPQVVHVKTSIEQLSKDSPQTAALKAEVSDLEARVKERSAHVDTVRSRAGWGPANRAAAGGLGTENGSSATSQLPPELMSLVRDSAGDIDPTVTAQFELAVRRFSGLQDEISSARIELDRAQAAFKHRYNVMSPPEVPSQPIKPKVRIIFLAGLAAGLLLGLIAALLAELRTGRIVERWQVAQLDLPILAELRLPPGPKS